MDHTITMADVRAICGMSDHATRRFFSDAALQQNFVERPGPSGGRPRRYWTLRALLPVLRPQPWFETEHEAALARLDLQQRKSDHV